MQNLSSMKLTYLIAFSFFFINSLGGQSSFPPESISVSYFGETITHPGVFVGTELPAKQKWLITIGVGTYLHYRHHRGVFVNGSLDWRTTFSSGFSMQYGIGLGYLHTWQHGGKTYTVNDLGEVKQTKNYGQSAFMPSLKFGLLGWDFRKKTDMPIRLFSEAILFGQYPHNNFIMPHFAMNIGGTYFLEK